MGLNDGRVHYNFQEIVNNGIDNSAEQFAEGSTLLKTLLLKLWEKGLFTYACCKGVDEPGHKVGLFKNPYIAILVEPNSEQAAIELLKSVMSSKDKSKPNIDFSTEIIQGQHRVSLVFSKAGIISNSTCNKMFESLLNCIDREKNAVFSKENEDAIKFAQELSRRIPAHPLKTVGIEIDKEISAYTKGKNWSKHSRKLKDVDLKVLTDPPPRHIERIISNINENNGTDKINAGQAENI